MRTSKIRAAIIGAVVVLSLGGCKAVPIYNVTDVPVTSASGKVLQASQVRQAIVTAGGTLGWRMADVGAGRLEGSLVSPTYTAVVDIPYSATKYSIQFRSAENLKVGDGTIHKRYNFWVQNLDRLIRSEISRL
jgi:hypothetical protein